MRNLELTRLAGERSNLANALLAYAEWLLRFNRIDEARKCAEEADILLQQIGASLSLVSRLFATIAWLDGNIPKARLYYLETQERLRVLGEKNIRSNILSSLGKLEMDDGNLSQAQEYLQQAVKTSQEIRNQMLLTRHLAKLGNLFYLQGKLEECKQNFRESLLRAREDSSFQKATVLILILNSLCSQNPEVSVRLLGAIDLFQKENQNPLGPLQVRDCDRAHANARQALSAVVFAKIRNEAQKMTLDDAIDLAMKAVEEF